MGIMFSIKKSVICTSLYQIENGGNSSAYQCSAYSRYDGGNDTAETLLRAVFYFGKSRIMDRELLIHKFHLRNHFGYIFILLMYFARDFFELFYSVRITFRACSYFGNEPFVYYDFSPLFCFYLPLLRHVFYKLEALSSSFLPLFHHEQKCLLAKAFL